MEPPPVDKWPGILVAAFLALTVGSSLSSVRSDAIGQVLSPLLPALGPAVSGDPVARVQVVVRTLVAVFLFLAIPGMLGLFKNLKP